MFSERYVWFIDLLENFIRSFESNAEVTVLTWTILNALIMLAIWSIAGYLKRRGLKTNYSRKFWQITASTIGIFSFHYLPFQVSFLLIVIGSVFLFCAVLKGEGNFFFEAIARESDAPHRGLYAIFGAYTALFGVLLAKYLFGSYYQLGALTLGWGDSMGEVIGARFGKHKYLVPTLTGITCTRSIEGSLAVLAASFYSLAIGLYFFTHITFNEVLPHLILVAVIIMCAEAISPHGMDNFTIPLTTCLAANMLF